MWETDASHPEWAERAAAEGWEYAACTVRRGLGSPPAPRPAPPGLRCRALVGDADWQVALEVALAAHGISEPAFMTWARGQLRARVEAGEAWAFGAFVDGALVASCGLVFGAGEARFQDVGVRPDQQGRHVGSHLIHTALARLHAERPGTPAFICADRETRADRVYAAQGMALVGHTHCLVLPISPDEVA
ncbi:MAG: GNAT family N-acetyltransferase [Myxococcales bacterium]|nr:GNAT family N-acetyltransferase [Myxococcales bacterium]